MVNSSKGPFLLPIVLALALFFSSLGWSEAGVMLGGLIVLAEAAVAATSIQEGWRQMLAEAAIEETSIEFALIPFLKALHRFLYRPSLPLLVLVILVVLNLTGIPLIVFVSLEILYSWLICLLTGIVKIGEQYPGVLTVATRALIWRLQPLVEPARPGIPLSGIPTHTYERERLSLARQQGHRFPINYE